MHPQSTKTIKSSRLVLMVHLNGLLFTSNTPKKDLLSVHTTEMQKEALIQCRQPIFVGILYRWASLKLPGVRATKSGEGSAGLRS